jgi:hypothetical protein
LTTIAERTSNALSPGLPVQSPALLAIKSEPGQGRGPDLASPAEIKARLDQTLTSLTQGRIQSIEQLPYYVQRGGRYRQLDIQLNNEVRAASSGRVQWWQDMLSADGKRVLAQLTAKLSPADARQAPVKPKDSPPPSDAGQPFVGMLIKGRSIMRPGEITIPSQIGGLQIPNVGGKTFSVKLPDGGAAAPGAIAYFPNTQRVLIVASSPTVPVPAISKDTMLGWAVSVSKDSVQVGLGNKMALDTAGNNLFFWNVRADAGDLARGAALSLRNESRGKEITLGTINAGLAHKPTCKEGEKPSHLADVVAGAGFQAQMVAKDGQIMVRHGTRLLPIAVWQTSVAAAMKAVAEVSRAACDNKTLLERVGDAARNALGLVRDALSSQEMQNFGAGVTAVVVGVVSFLLRPVTQRHAY